MTTYTEKSRNKYEIDCDEDGNVRACFCEIATTVFRDNTAISTSYHRDVMDFTALQPLVATLKPK